MSEKEGSPASLQPLPARPRPVLLTLICLFAFTWFALLSVLSILFVFNGERIALTRNLYFPGDNVTTASVTALFIAWLLLHATGFAGTLLIWYRRRTGYFLVVAACLATLTYQFIRHSAVPGSTGVHIALILLFTFFYRRLR